MSEVDLDDYNRHETEGLEDYLASDDFYPFSQDYPEHSEPSAVHEYAQVQPDSYGDNNREVIQTAIIAMMRNLA